MVLTKAEHPSNKLEQLIGSTGVPLIGKVVRLEHPEKLPAEPVTLRFNGPQEVIDVIFLQSPVLKNSHPVMVPVMVMVLTPGLAYE